MISRRFLLFRHNLFRRILPFNIQVNNLSYKHLGYSVARKPHNDKYIETFHLSRTCANLLQIQRKCYSDSILEGDVTEFQRIQEERNLSKIKSLFPNPRVTLNSYSAKTPQKVYDLYYKQNTMFNKGARKKLLQVSEWTCCYAFVWPEKMEIECTALTKRQAAEKASLQALQWLYSLKRIDNQGNPIYNREVLTDLRTTHNQPLHIEVSKNTIEKVEKIYEHYTSRIKPVYEATFEEVAHEELEAASVFNKDSSLDEEEELSEDDVSELDSIIEQRVHPVYGRVINPPTKSTIERRAKVLAHRFDHYDNTITTLPIDKYSHQINSALENSRVLIIVGAAGCGKSTRAPAFILKDIGAKSSILVSEPRRVAAIGLADRVASELGEDVGETVGYQVRLRARLPRPPTGSILYCTSGVLLRRLKNNPGLEGCTHVFIDEAHERDVNTDVTLLLLKRALELNLELKVIVMSATLDVEVFTKYFKDCPIVEVPGRTFPVSVTYIDEIEKKFNIRLPFATGNCTKQDGRPLINCQEVVDVIKAVDRSQPEGAILVFLPGWAEIVRTQTLLEGNYRQSSTHIILPVHSRLSTSDQTKMFTKTVPGVRKIVLSTNIAETSVTVPDVVYVIDTGAQKINTIGNSSGTSSLESAWVSQAAAKQRMGRAGRVQPGHCYRLYTKEKEDEFEPHMSPEILRVPLDQTVLELKSFIPNGSIVDFLSDLPEPPSKKAVEWAINDLVQIGALTQKENITRLGVLLSSLTLRPRLALTLLHSRVVGNLGAVCGLLPINGSFYSMVDSSEIREFKKRYSVTSDHSAVNWMLHDYEEILREKGYAQAEKWCQDNGLRRDKLRHLRALTNLHLEQLLKSQLITDTEELNEYSQIDELTPAVLVSGCDNLLVTRKYVKTKGKLKTKVDVFTSTGERAHIGGESVNYGITKRSNDTNILTYYGGYHSTERRALVVHSTSLIPAHTAILFCMSDIRSETMENDENTTVLTLPKHKLSIHIPTSQADTILKTREMLHQTLRYYTLRDTKTMNFDDDAAASKFKHALIKAAARILCETK